MPPQDLLSAALDAARLAGPAWEFQAGKLCWFINGTICECKSRRNWQEKMKICRSCEVLADLL